MLAVCLVCDHTSCVAVDLVICVAKHNHSELKNELSEACQKEVFKAELDVCGWFFGGLHH